MKRILLFFAAAVLFFAPLSCKNTINTVVKFDFQIDTIKLLTIGNSFSDDAVEQHLYGLCQAAGVPIVIGNAYIPGCSLERHSNNAKTGKSEYSYRKIVNGKRSISPNHSLESIVIDEDWNIVSFQQGSAICGVYESYEPYLTDLIDYIIELLPETKLAWHQTWAYDEDSWHDAFPTYDSNQKTMYEAILDCTRKANAAHQFDLIVPNGTAIQNARGTALKHRLTRDSYHLSYNYGRYLASCTWFEALTARSSVGNSYKPEALTDEEARICQLSASKAIKSPKKVSTIISTYTAMSDYTVQNGKIYHKTTPYYYIGTNMWYAADLYKIDKERLYKELDLLKSMGITNLRILAAEGDVESLKKTLGAMDERGMTAVLYLNNSWEWSDTGYRTYLEEAGAGTQPTPATAGYHAYTEAMSEFASNEKALNLFYAKVKHIVYQLKNSPAIFAWQICNEPRPFSTDSKKMDDFVKYLEKTSEIIKSVDPIHLVSTGSEGLMGCNDGDSKLLEKINRIKTIDYITVHIWPWNWSWVNSDNLEENIDVAIEKTAEYIDNHIVLAKKVRKPIVIEEFGYPRDGFAYENSSTTNARDKYYKFVFSKVIESSKNGGIISGCNFWAWNGFARQVGHQFWQPGDDLCGDPRHEAQGLYGVYAGDTTIEVIKDCIIHL